MKIKSAGKNIFKALQLKCIKMCTQTNEGTNPSRARARVAHTSVCLCRARAPKFFLCIVLRRIQDVVVVVVQCVLVLQFPLSFRRLELLVV